VITRKTIGAIQLVEGWQFSSAREAEKIWRYSSRDSLVLHGQL
jgi:hypothetical protein